jgi:hypothetical protein
MVAQLASAYFSFLHMVSLYRFLCSITQASLEHVGYYNKQVAPAKQVASVHTRMLRTAKQLKSALTSSMQSCRLFCASFFTESFKGASLSFPPTPIALPSRQGCRLCVQGRAARSLAV